MKISYNWLKQFIAIDKPAEELGRMLTSAGLEVEGIHRYEPIRGGLEGIVIGEVLTCAKHPNADSLSVTTVDIGAGEPVPIVCGAPNVAAGQKVAVATVGATMYPGEGEPFKIKKAKIRGEVSEGMICAEDEIGLGESHDGIMVLNTTLPNGTPAAQYFNLTTDDVFEIGLTPNRADAASHYGVARDLKVLLGEQLCLISTQNFKADNQSRPVKVVVEDPEACPRYTGITVSGVTVQESPAWLKQRLESIGVTPINNVVDVTNYILHDIGQPLHAFDADKIAHNAVIIKTLPKDTPFRTLDNAERKLSENDLMICDGDERPMCIAGVFGGADSGINEQTKNIFIESAYFSPAYIRKTSQHHSLKTDASFRFERGTNPTITVYAAQRAAMLIKEIAGGHISSDITDVYLSPVKNREITATYKNIDRLIGKQLPRETIKNILHGLEMEILEENDQQLRLSVPPYRVDVEREADLVEEILRIYGYDNIELSEHLSADFLADFPEVDKDKVKIKITQLLAANGCFEIITNSLTSPAYTDSLPGFGAEGNVEILNKLSPELSIMRRTLIFSGLETIVYNVNRRHKDLKVFEFGKVYSKTRSEDGRNVYNEKVQLGIFVTGNRTAETWQQKSTKVTFHDLAGLVSMILEKLNITGFEQVELSSDLFQYGLSIVWRKKEIARLGLLQKNILKQVDLKQEVFYAELDWEYIAGKFNTQLAYQDISKFPEVRRDLSLVLDRKVTFEEIRKLAFQTERNILQKVNVFDVYEGENIGADKKAYAVSFTLQDQNKTLTDDVIDKTMQKLMAAFEGQLSAHIRK